MHTNQNNDTVIDIDAILNQSQSNESTKDTMTESQDERNEALNFDRNHEKSSYFETFGSDIKTFAVNLRHTIYRLNYYKVVTPPFFPIKKLMPKSIVFPSVFSPNVADALLPMYRSSSEPIINVVSNEHTSSQSIVADTQPSSFLQNGSASVSYLVGNNRSNRLSHPSSHTPASLPEESRVDAQLITFKDASFYSSTPELSTNYSQFGKFQLRQQCIHCRFFIGNCHCPCPRCKKWLCHCTCQF